MNTLKRYQWVVVLFKQLTVITLANMVVSLIAIFIISLASDIEFTKVNYGITLWSIAVVYLCFGYGSNIGSMQQGGSLPFVLGRTTSLSSYDERMQDLMQDRRDGIHKGLKLFIYGLPSFVISYLFMI